MELELIFATAFVLEIIFCAIPGSITAEALRRGISRGFRPSLMVQIGSIVGDTVWAVIALVGLAFLVESQPVQLGLGLIGCAFLLYLAYSAFIEARKGGMPEPKPGQERGDLMTGVVLSLGNPFQVAFWLGIGATTIATIAPNPQASHYIAFMLGFEVAAVLWCFMFAYAVGYGRKYVTARTFQVIEVVCGIFLAYVGLSLLWSTLDATGVI
jgi:threonine/homoserine/homoserine lactone efflux protein